MRRRLTLVLALACVLTLLPGLSLLRAHAHYVRGRQAFDAGRYDRAAVEFSAATVLTVSFRDAETLSSASRRLWKESAPEVRVAPSYWPLRYRLLLSRTLRELRDGKFFSASISISQLRTSYPGYPLDLGRHGSRAAIRGSVLLLRLAEELAGKGRWPGARAYATASLHLQPSWPRAFDLEQTAYRMQTGA
jgi:hypothetical protein